MGHDGLNILLLPVDDRWVAHLLEHDLMGSGKTRAAAFESALTAYKWCQEKGELAKHHRSSGELWAQLSDAKRVSIEELYRAQIRRSKSKPRRSPSSKASRPSHPTGVPPELLATVPMPWMIHALKQHVHARA